MIFLQVYCIGVIIGLITSIYLYYNEIAITIFERFLLILFSSIFWPILLLAILILLIIKIYILINEYK